MVTGMQEKILTLAMSAAELDILKKSDKETSKDVDVAQLCFMAKDDHSDEVITTENFDYNKLELDFLELSENHKKLKLKITAVKKKVLSLLNTDEELEGEKKELDENVEFYTDENGSLKDDASKKENSYLSSEIQSLRSVKIPVENEFLKSQLKKISTQKGNLEKEIEDLNLTLSNFTQGRENLGPKKLWVPKGTKLESIVGHVHINLIKKLLWKELVRGLPKLKFVKDKYLTSVKAVAALIWGCAIEVISMVTNEGPKQTSILAVPVNVRIRMRPVLPKSSIGNLVWTAFAQHMPDAKLEFPCIVDRIKTAFAQVDYDFVKSMKGNEGYAKVSECLKEYAELLHNIDEDNCLVLSSLRKVGISEVNFGWGKPSWYYFCNPGIKSFVFLMDTISGDGIEALVSLSGQAMVIFERDPKLLVFVFVDPSPL
ncbi:hypothetical protein RJ640_023634 [Escallonia rubra]|uniref:Uncharacterized protein n=1 Tax=Escallonia rubra TaxID=112253 RepID=A0AA88RDD7_9ASTE|nr:hypothetical protein RJ640_023634 [Escallonia rubra]